MSNLRTQLFVALAAIFVFGSIALAGNDWKPIEPAELALKAGIVDKDADAEALFWDVRVLDEVEGGEPRTVLNHYIRIKIFNDRGKESQSQIKLIYFNGTNIKNILGRTIKPDGTSVELKKEDIFERTEVKGSGLKVKAKSFAMPGVEPGCIIEYKWREERQDRLANYIRLQFQQEVPVEKVTYHVKPLSLPDFEYGMRIKTFHANPTPFAKEKDGFYATTLENVPAFREEPRMPPEDQVRAWMLVYYSKDDKEDPDKYWKKLGKEKYESSKGQMKISDEVKSASTQAIGDATEPEKKLDRIFEFCRYKIKNINNVASGVTAEERSKAKNNKTPTDTLKRGMGTGTDIDMLFGAMAIAAGFEVRVANLSDRSDIFFDKSFPDDYFMKAYDMAVKVGSEWRFYDPASTYVPEGMLRWQEEGQQALISDPKEPTFVLTPLSPAEKSVQKRTAKLALSEDGTIEGDVTIEYTGHLSVDKKNFNDQDSQVQREQNLIDTVKKRLSTAELTNISIDNVTDPAKPYVYKYHIKVPGYGQRTGKRIFFQPAFFEYGLAPMFTSSKRIHPVYFSYPWSEQDQVRIDLPTGYALDNADAPNGFSAQDVTKYEVNIGVTKDQKTMVYKRNFMFGGGGKILFPSTSYPQLKALFESLNKADNHTITLKQTATASAAAAPSN
jgi:hypothetical protein